VRANGEIIYDPDLQRDDDKNGAPRQPEIDRSAYASDPCVIKDLVLSADCLSVEESER
jgi:hypothetical protein